ncbi:MAG TPA: CHRD domain-containing protein [Thermoleophilaceae bacterium]|nr:CHRD domain-containing protein [Thermoleophilaceae bacterium]
MKKRRIQLAAAVAIVSIASVVATTAVAGDGKNAKAKLSGFEEVPAVLTDGSGKFKAKISRTEQRIDYTLSYEDLEGGGVLFAHIHIGQRLANGNVAAFLCGGGTKPAPCPPSGTVTGTITPADVVPVPQQGVVTFADLVEAIREGITYANVHTMRSPGGEIRGQIDAGGGDRDDDDDDRDDDDDDRDDDDRDDDD